VSGFFGVFISACSSALNATRLEHLQVAAQSRGLTPTHRDNLAIQELENKGAAAVIDARYVVHVHKVAPVHPQKAEGRQSAL